jgi:hypothetical protein
VCLDQQIWRMSSCQWATIFSCEKSFWEGARLLVKSGHEGVSRLEQRHRYNSKAEQDNADTGKVTLFVRHQFPYVSSRSQEVEKGDSRMGQQTNLQSICALASARAG